MRENFSKDRDHIHRLRIRQQVLFNVAYIGAPVLMTPFSFKWHLKLRTRLALRLLQAVELPVRGHDPATGRGADLDAYAQQRRMDTVFSRASGSPGVYESRFAL
jgi:hypothetical protein